MRGPLILANSEAGLDRCELVDLAVLTDYILVHSLARSSACLALHLEKILRPALGNGDPCCSNGGPPT
jgi:hypothetical protein